MSFQRRLRTIALSGLKNIKDRLDQIDLEDDMGADPSARAEADARRELADTLRSRETSGGPLRSPEQIVASAGGVRAGAEPVNAATTSEPLSQNPLDRHYRRMGLEPGAEYEAVHAAYTQFVARCALERYPEGSDEQKMAAEILARVEESYDALREALDPTAGRFDKLEL
jgi:hypothetical protein